MKNKVTQRMVRFMEASPLHVAFVITAMQKYSCVVMEDRNKTIDLMKNTFIDGEAWIRLAEEWNGMGK